MKSNIRVGVVTCGIRKDLLPFPHDVYVDKERRGAAFGKNELIRKGEVAKFDGVLMDNEKANETHVRLLERDLYKELS